MNPDAQLQAAFKKAVALAEKMDQLAARHPNDREVGRASKMRAAAHSAAVNLAMAIKVKNG